MHKSIKKWSVLAAALTLFAVVAAACQAAPDTDQVSQLQTQVAEAEQSGGSAEEVAALQTRVAEAEAEAAATDAPDDGEATAEPPTDRVGGWFDTIVIGEEPNANAAVERLLAGDLDAYLFAVGDPEVFAKIQDNDEALDWWASYGLSDELTFNTAGPEFANGSLNPFSVPAVREAMNWLIDREYVVSEIMGGLGTPRYTTVSTADPDYVNYIDIISPLEAEYAYNPDRANEVITAEMEALGATMEGDQWTYNDAPVTIILVIRTEDKRREIGDYVANQLESIGFATQRDYKNFSEAATCWRSADPTEGCFHIYTGGWSSTQISLDSGSNFGFWYTPLGAISVNSSTYTPTEEFMAASEALWLNSFTSLDERRELFSVALPESMRDSTRVWIVDQRTVSPFRSEIVASGDIAGGLSGSALWAYTMRREGEVGGSLDIAMPSLMSEPWNPLQGSNALYDAAVQRAVSESATVADPFTGHHIPMSVESAELTVQADLPVGVTKDWITLDTADEIVVPGDIWGGWDPVAQRFITVDERAAAEAEAAAAEATAEPEGTAEPAEAGPVTAFTKVTYHFPEDMFSTVTWHDGSPLTMGDFVMGMITTFDIGNPESPYHDPASAPALDAFMGQFKGFNIVSEDPLVVEVYSDFWATDAEVIVGGAGAGFWPYYTYGQAPWHTMAMGLMAQEAGSATFSADLASELQVEQQNWLAGPTMEIFSTQLEAATAESLIPYAPTLGEYVTADEAATRYANLAEWFRVHNHFWVGTGPYVVEKAFPVEGTVILEHNPNYHQPSDRWSGFAEAAVPVAIVDGPSEVTIGDTYEATVSVSFNDEPYAAEDIRRVLYLVYDAEGALVIQGEAEGGENGEWNVSFDTSDLPEGSNRLQVIVISRRVGLPVFVDQQFVTTN